MSVLDKFALKPEHKEEVKKAFADMIDRQFDSFQDSYAAAFKGLPYEVLENMTDKQAYELVGLVIKEATDGMRSGLEALDREMKKLAGDPERMEAVRKKFMEGMAGGASADIPDVPKSNMEVD